MRRSAEALRKEWFGTRTLMIGVAVIRVEIDLLDAFADVAPNLDFRVVPTLHIDPAGDVGDLHHAMRLHRQTLLEFLRVRQPGHGAGTQHKQQPAFE